MDWAQWYNNPWFHVVAILGAVGLFIHVSKALHNSVNVSTTPSTVQHDARQIEELVREAKRLQEAARVDPLGQPIQTMLHLNTAVTLLHTALHLLPLNYNNTTVLTPLQHLNQNLLEAYDVAVEVVQRLLPHTPKVARFLLF